MKKIISAILVFTLLISTVNISFAAEVENGDIISYSDGVSNIDKALNFQNENVINFNSIEYAEDDYQTSCIPSKQQLLTSVIATQNDENAAETHTQAANSAFSGTDFTFNPQLLTKFNTVTGPTISNGANEPKFSYNSFIKENISDYSGELTLNFEDLVLAGRNGLDLRIGRTYQTVASSVGEKSLMVLPNKNGYLRNYLINNYSTYLIDRYNLGMGWGFNFPSVQIETEYIPEEIVDTYYYEEETELYYHSGNGEVYQVQFTSDTTDSNLKGYYDKDIQFNKNDTAFTNGQRDSRNNLIYSYYSMTLADKTKQYFAKDGRLLGIVDRFGNTVKFEHELSSVVNRVPDGNFRYDDDMWISSTGSDNRVDAVQQEDDSIGSNDGYMMYFRRNNSNGAYIISQPIQVKPLTYYDFGMRFKSQYGDDVKVEIIGYDTAYSIMDTETIWITDYDTENWVDFSKKFSMSSAVRYVQIKISPDYANKMYIDSVKLDEPKPLIKKITDSVGRTITFDYQGDITTGEKSGSLTLTVTSPTGESTRTMTYNKEAIEFGTKYLDHDEQRLYWYLTSSTTEGADGASVKYTYEGGTTANADGTLNYPKLYSRYDTKTHSDTDGWINKPVLNSVRYKDRKKIYEYETVRKHMGDDGYYDTLRIKKKYDMYSYVPEGSTKSYFTGEVGTVNYSYSGTYNNAVYDNETGYPNYKFDEDTALNEMWTITKTGKTTDSVTFSNCAVVKQTVSDGETVSIADYTNHSVFKNSPTQIKNTVTQNGESRESYILYSYNDWGGVENESKEVDEAVKNNPAELAKYTTTYQYEPNYHLITQRSFYNNKNKEPVSEKYTYNAAGLLTKSENAVKEKTQYYYENETFPYLVTKSVQDDPMHFNNVLGGDRIVTYAYDNYGLYATTVSEQYRDDIANTSYDYDYITGYLLKKTLPDGSDTQYTYYSDGKIKTKISPLTQYLDGKVFYTIERYTYNSNAVCDNYKDETPTFDVEQVSRYRVFTDDSQAAMYSADINFYDAVGNLKVNQKYDFSKKDENNYYLRYYTKYYHDNYDRLIKIVDNENHSTSYAYDGFDRPASVTDSENNVYSYTYNSPENKVDLYLNTNKHLMTQYFDLYGNVVKNSVYPTNTADSVLSEEYEYDLNNNAVSYTDANGNTTAYLYDAVNRLKETILPNGEKATSNYSAFNEPSFEKVFDSTGREKSARITYRNEKGDMTMKFFSYDRLLVESYSYSADSKGRTTKINENGNIKTITYDETDNPIIMKSGESETHRRYNWFGEVAAASTDGNTPEIRYNYNALGNISAKLQNGTHYMAYTYSTIGNITQSTMPSERSESYTYSANGNLDTIASDGKTFDYDYYDTGYMKSITYPGGLKTVYEYDNINRITKVTTSKNGVVINTFEYEYDGNGNATKEIRNGVQTLYSYDSLDRLISVTYGDGSGVSYEYDALNNRTKEIYSNGDVQDYVYDTKYQLKEIKLNGQVTDTFTYNPAGAVLTHNNKTFTYDEWDRMSGYSDGTNSYTYKYDANGIRTQKNNKQYIIDINNNVVAETDSDGNITDEIIWGHQPLARKINGNWYYYIYNAHGDVVGLTDDAGTVVNTYDYTPWGEIRSETETVENPIKYAGEYYDDELNMIYLRARYYDPKIGRFTSYDIEEGEISNPLDMNRYVYCRNNPVKYVDPSGEFAAAAAAATAPWWAPYVAAGLATVIGGTIVFYKEHTSNKRKSNLNKHQEGQARKARDAGGEKGDARRTPRKDKKK